MRKLCVIVLLAAAGVAHATPPEPTGPHPRMLLDEDLRRDWKTYGKLPVGPVAGAIKLCDEARTTPEHHRALYQGAEWAKVLQACLVAWAATDDKNHANTAIKYFTALLDDLDNLGDGKGGDDSAHRDHGYAIRNLGPYTALAYDWLYKQMPEDLKARARQRWKAWLDWYKESGYRARVPGSNYQAGYLISATMIAIAEAGDAGADGKALWALVADELWGKDMAHALTTDGVLAGGDWPEGWQYGPLSVAEYALAGRLMKRAGVDVPGMQPWLSSLLRRHIYALSPADMTYAGGDTENETPNLPPSVLTLAAVALGDASPQDKAWARGELSRLQIADKDYFLYDSLAGVGDKPQQVPRDAWPTWYVSANTGTLYARTRWDQAAIWFVAECHATIETDHRHPNAGTFSLSRGKDDVIVDPTPYGSQSTLTSNAPTVESAILPKDYVPSQGSWSVTTGYDFITQRASGIVAARCDYSDQFKFQDKASDVPAALRDWVLIPDPHGSNADLVVVDRADTGARDRAMDLRFRTPGKLVLDGTGLAANATVGSSKLAVTLVTASAGSPALGAPTDKDCYKFKGPKGQCDAARFPVTDYHLRVAGPHPWAVHLISTASGHDGGTVGKLGGDNWAGVYVTGNRSAAVIWRTKSDGPLAYSAPAHAMHVVLDAPEGGKLEATKDGKNCNVRVTGTGGPGKPLVAMLDENCSVTEDPEAAAASAVGTKARKGAPSGGPGASARSPRSGCCGAEAAPGSAFAMTLVVVPLLIARRRRSVRRSSR